MPIRKVDDEKREIIGWAALVSDDNGDPLLDFQDDLITVESLRKASQDLVTEGGKDRAGEMHKRRVGDIVGAMVLGPDEVKALGFKGVEGGPTGLAVVMKIHDDMTWARVKSGELSELSISGEGTRTPLAA